MNSNALLGKFSNRKLCNLNVYIVQPVQRPKYRYLTIDLLYTPIYEYINSKRNLQNES